MTNSNLKWSLRTPRAQAMAAYDALPVVLRRRLAEAPFNFNSLQIHGMLQRGQSVEKILRVIDQAEISRLTK